MKKGLKLTVASVMAMSAVTPVAVLANEASAGPAAGFYTADGYYSPVQFKNLTKEQQQELLKRADLVLVLDEKVYPRTVVGKSDAEIANLAIPVAQFEAENGKLTEGGYGEAPVAELKVESVSAINSTTLEVNFTVAPEGFDNSDISITNPVGNPVGNPGNWIITKVSDTKFQVKLDAELGLGQYTLTVNKDGFNKVGDTTAKNPLQYVKFEGVASADKLAPTVASAEYNVVNKKVTIVFSENVKAASLNKEKLAIVAGTSKVTLGANDTANFTTANTLEITLSSTNATAVAALTGDLSLAVEEGAVVDTADNKIAAASNISLSPTAQIQSASYDASTNVLTLNFTKEVKVNTLDVTNISLTSSADTRTLTVADVVSTTTNGKTVSIQLTEDATLAGFEGATVTNRKVVLASNPKFVTTDNKVVVAGNVDVTYTADTVAPTLVSASYNATTKRLILNFSEPVKADATAIGTKVTITDAVNTSTGAAVSSFTLDVGDLETAANSYSKTLAFEASKDSARTNSLATGVDNILLTSKSKVYFAKDAFVDGSGNKNVALSSDNAVVISYLDQTAPEVTSSAIQKSTNTIQVIFNKEVTKASAETIANYAITAAGSTGLTVKSATLLSDEKTLVITTNENIAIGTIYSIKVSNVVSKFGNVSVPAASNNTATFTGANVTDTTAPTFSTLTFKDVDGNYKLSRGDTLTLKYNVPVVLNDTKITDYTVNNNREFGTGATVKAGANSDEVVITLGEGTTVTFGDAISQTATGAVKSLTGVYATSGSAVIAKPDTTKPEITKAVFADASVDGKVSTNDTVTLTFSEDLDRSVAASKILDSGALVFASDDTFGTGAIAEYVDARTIKVTLGTSSELNGTGSSSHIGSDATVKFGTTLSVTDLWGNAGNDLQGAIKITSDDTTRPEVQSVKIVKDASNTTTKLAAGDKIQFTLSENVDVEANAAVGDVVAYIGTTAKTSASTTGAFSVSGKVVTFTLSGSDTNLVGETISDITSITLVPAGASKITDASGNQAKAPVGYGIAPQ